MSKYLLFKHSLPISPTLLLASIPPPPQSTKHPKIAYFRSCAPSVSLFFYLY